MSVNDELGKRMKEYYEQIPKTKLMRRTPVILRFDGKAFHTFTKGFEKPFDEVLMQSMQETMLYLCKHIQGAVFGYTQSDEITLVLVDYAKLNSSAWFDYEVQKMCSIGASMCTMAFNKIFTQLAEAKCDEIERESKDKTHPRYANAYYKTLKSAILKGAMFDCRCFNIPKEEVCNVIYWRQVDATRNSIQMVGQANFSHKELQKKTCNMIQDMLHEQKGINWNDFPTTCKRGTSCIKVVTENDRTQWIIDTEMPILKGEDRSYVETLVYV